MDLPTLRSEDGGLAVPRSVFDGAGQSLFRNHIARPSRMKFENFLSVDLDVRGQAQDFATGAIDVKWNAIGVGADHNIGGRFQNGGQASLGCFGALALDDLALERRDLAFEFMLGHEERFILLLDLSQHLIEGIGEDTDFVRAYFLGSDPGVLVLRNRARGAGETQDRLRDETLKAAGEKEGEEERESENQGEDTGVELEQLRGHHLKIGVQEKSPLPIPIAHDRLREKDMIAFDSEAFVQGRGLVLLLAKLGESFAVRELEACADDLRHVL